MAKTYVVKLEIDGVSESVNSINGLEEAVAKLESQLKSADLGSEEFKKLSKELGNAQKELGGFQTEIDNLDPAAQAQGFVAMGEGIAGGFAIATGAAAMLGIESQTLEKTMVGVQGAIAIAVGYRSLVESKLTEAIGQSVIAEKARAAATGVSAFVTGAATKGVKAFRLALISTGIGALIVAVGLLVAYWDDIKALVSGVSGEQQKLNEEAEQNVKTQQEGLDAISAQENSLRLQGKSEKEIRDMKIAQTDEIITATQLQLEQMEATKKAQVDAAKRNKDIAMGIIAFLSAPIVMLLGAVDALTYGLSLTGLLDEGTNLAEGFVDGAASLLFDPEEIASEGDAAIAETKNQLTKLKNARDGMILADNAEADSANKAARDKTAAEKAKEKEQEEKDAEDKKVRIKEEAKALEDLNNELALLALDNEFKRAQAALDQQEAADLLAIAGAENFEEQKHAIELKYTALSNEVATNKAASDIALAKTTADEKIAIEEALAESENTIQNAKLQAIGDGFKIISELAGKNRAAQAISIIGENAVGIASNIINTMAANAVLTKQGGVAAPALIVANQVRMGLGIASSIMATKKALSALKQGGDASGGVDAGSMGGGGGAPNLGTPEQTSNIDFGFLGNGDVSQIGETAPVQAYVLGADVSSTLEANQVIKDQSTL
tara:strand:- start:571 stop:2571 length:2001 start_codon:yes stop_codon:yes gene_type:complete